MPLRPLGVSIHRLLIPLALAVCCLARVPFPALADDTVQVREGDTLSSISMAYFGDVTHVQAIAALNRLSDSSHIEASQKLKLPTGARAGAAPSSAAAGTHVVRQGDTLSSISLDRFGDLVHVESIAAVNGLGDSGQIYAGQNLKLPAGGAITPRPIPSVQSGVGTWYGPGFEGKITKCGQVYHQVEQSAASNDLPCGTIIEVTNLDNGRSVVVPVTDTGGFRHPNILDMSRGAFSTLAHPKIGVIPIRVNVRSLPTKQSLPSASSR